MKAPSSGPIPIKLVPNVVPIQMKSVKSKNKSLFLVLAASLNASGMNHFAPTYNMTTSPIHFTISEGRLLNASSCPPRRGVISITIITAMSWKIRIPNVTLP
ncbi:MAG: hypothetical protein UIB63_08600 [Methanobrevibacter sp.]|uniref:hypothetical protein n=1 Tax=Methanobrevibacter sp. TaxID=66852 RepID=UPI0025D12E5F|nr:hypothetical protein [Methanobrevibacter sp.]MEE0943156.1 hypothetical protein [Methanobrevibacter sp.]